MKRLVRDAGVLAGGLASCAAFLALLYLDLNAVSAAQAGTPVGVLVLKKRVAQRRPADRVVWLPLEREEPLYDLDAVRTEAGSEALIRLNDSTELFLSENSMVLLDFSGARGSVEFMEGSIIARRAESAAASEALLIKAEGAELDLRAGGSVDLGRDSGGAVSVGVSGGSVTVRSREGESTVAADQSATVSAGSASVKAAVIVPRSPAAGEAAFGPGPLVAVSFAWSAEEASPPFSLELSRTRGFDARKAADAAGTAATLDLEPGDWFWRVRDSAGAESRVLPLKVVADIIPKPLAPSDGEVLRFRTAAPPVRLAWEPVDGANGYEYELSADRAFSLPARSGRTANASAQIEDLPAGTWYWRVRVRYDHSGIGAGSPSAPRTFRLESVPVPPAPAPAVPADGASVDAVEAGKGVLFVWESSADAARYELAVTATDGTAPAGSPAWSGTQSFARVALPAVPGAYSWTVRAVAADGAASPPSAPRTLSLAARQAPEPTAPADGTELEASESAAVAFAWRSSGASVLSVSAFADMRNPLDTAASASGRASLALPGPGEYWWSVADPASGLTSRPRRIVVLTALGSPALLSPARDEALRLSGVPSLELTFSAVPGATAYRASLRKLGAAETVAEYVVAASPASVPVEALAPGDYAWSVRAEQARPGRTVRFGPAAFSSFRLVSVRAVPPAVPASPADGVELDGLAVLRNGVKLSWKASEPGVEYAVSLERADGSIILDTTTKGLSLSVPDPGPGSYRWSVGGAASDGTPLVPAAASFSVAAVTPLDPVAVKTPKAGGSVDMTKADALVFSWGRVSGATSYELTLRETKTGRLVFKRVVDRAVELVYRDLENLDVGSFSLTIRALAVAADGSVERSGPERTTTFSMVVATPSTQPTLLSPTDIYVKPPTP